MLEYQCFANGMFLKGKGKGKEFLIFKKKTFFLYIKEKGAKNLTSLKALSFKHLLNIFQNRITQGF